jgi:hypothetical protein
MYPATKLRHLRIYILVAGFFIAQFSQAQLFLPTKCQLIFKRALDLEQKALANARSSLRHAERTVRNFYPIRVVRNNWARPKTPDLAWSTAIVNFWYYTPGVSFTDRKKVAEIFHKYRKAKHKSIAEIKFSAEESALLDKYHLKDKLDYFLKASRKPLSVYQATRPVDLVSRMMFSILTYIPGMPMPRKVIANHVYNMALLDSARGKARELKPWQEAFFKEAQNGKSIQAISRRVGKQSQNSCHATRSSKWNHAPDPGACFVYESQNGRSG